MENAGADGYGSVRDAEIDETIEREIALCEAVLKKTRQIIGDAQIMIDHTFHPRSLELAKLLLTHGFSVTRIYLDAVNLEEKATFEWLKQQYPGLSYEPTIHPEMRVRPRKEEKYTGNRTESGVVYRNEAFCQSGGRCRSVWI